MKNFNIWSTGYRITGNDGTAHFHGTQIANSFQEACDKFFSNKNNDKRGDYDSQRLTFWGCSLHDNEKDARIPFG
jgi:hypothetical protein